MDYSLVILDRVQEEIDEAFEYYAKISFNVLQSFDRQLDEVYRRLETNPYFHSRYRR